MAQMMMMQMLANQQAQNAAMISGAAVRMEKPGVRRADTIFLILTTRPKMVYQCVLSFIID